MVKNTHRIAFWPVHGWLPVPPRRPLHTSGGRRPTVAILDTGVAEHHWFDDAVVRVGSGDGADLKRHGTFVAGIVRQYAPDAQILSIELAQDGDGKVKDGEISEGLRWLRDRATTKVRFVDVVCLAVGYRKPYAGDDKHHTDEIGKICRELGERGVLLVTSAGNLVQNDAPPSSAATVDPVYPAALADPDTEFPIVAVGATDADGNLTNFNIPDAPWVTRKWVGENVVSAFPALPGAVSVPATFDPIAVPPDPSSEVDLVVDYEKFDLEGVGFTSGFAVGSGTSFAAAGFAGRVAQAMLDNAGHSGLTDVDPAAARTRVRMAMAAAGGHV